MMKRNILFITADQMRHDCLGFQGKFPTRSPHIDRLAREGTVFANAYCANPLCVPSRAAIMTGRHSFDTGVYYNDQPWADALPTLPGELAKNGYDTIALGKMHFLPRRRHAGFRKMLNEADYGDSLRRKHAGRKKTPPAAGPKATWDENIVRHYTKAWNPDNEWDDYEPVFHTNNALRELQNLVSRRDCTGEATEPFFMWLSFLRPHSPCCPPPPFSTWYHPDQLPPVIKTEEERRSFAKPLREFARGWTALSDALIADFRARYLADVSIVDLQIGRVLDSLRRLGLADNTLVIISSDHGDYLGDHHMQQKAFFHDASCKVPLIFHGPGVQRGQVASQNASLVDLLPTLLDYCGVLPPTEYDGMGQPVMGHPVLNPEARSLRPVLEGHRLAEDRIVIAETGIYGQGIMAKVGEQKYNYYPQTEEFDHFDLSQDPNELQNLGRSVTMTTLPSAVRDAFTRVMERTAPMAQRHYVFEGKSRPMFS